MRILIIDDDPERHEQFNKVLQGHDIINVDDFDSAINTLKQKPRFELIFLDHDLGVFNDRSTVYDMYGSHDLSGADVAGFIVQNLEREKWPDKVIIHSLNPAGAKNIFHVLNDAGISAELQPFRTMV